MDLHPREEVCVIHTMSFCPRMGKGIFFAPIPPLSAPYSSIE